MVICAIAQSIWILQSGSLSNIFQPATSELRVAQSVSAGRRPWEELKGALECGWIGLIPK